MIKCIVVDDEPLARSLLESHIEEVPFLEHCASFKNAILASEFLANNKVDLIFLDIQMPVLTGIELLKSLMNAPKVIFTTAYREYAVESYEFEVVDYLLKPITFDRFFKAVHKLSRTAPNQDARILETVPPYIFVQSNRKYIKVILDEVMYVESLKDYLKIHFEDRILVVKERISAFAKLLPSQNFLQVHRSYIVALNKITAFTQQDIEIHKIEIPIGGSYKEEVLALLKTTLR